MQARNYKHIIWDWNGTLFDDITLCVDIMNGMLRKYNLEEMSEEKYKNIFTVPVIDYYATLGFNVNDGTFEVVGKEFIDNYEIRRNEAKLYPQSVDVLKEIKNMGVGQSILSGYFQDTLNEIIPYYNLDPYFDKLIGLGNVYGGSKIGNGKFLIKELGCTEGETLLIGDTIHDYEVANAIGADCILITHGHQSKDRLMQSNTKIIHNLTDLL